MLAKLNLGFSKKMSHFSVLLMAAFFAAETAKACTLDQSGPMPICGGLTIAPETDVIIIESSDAGELTNVLLGPELHSAKSVNVVIGEVPRPITIVVSHHNAAVLNFTGNVEYIDQVVAMGASGLGWDYVATTGIDVRKVSFLPVVGQDWNLITTCSAPPKACVPEQYFDLDGEARSVFDNLALDPQYIRMEPTTYIGPLRQDSVIIPEKPAPVEEPKQETAAQTEEFRWPQNWLEELEWYNKYNGDLATFAQDQLTSPTTLTLDPNLPSWAGIARLVEEGQLTLPGDYNTDDDLRRFSRSFNQRYRTRFDPNFSFEPHVDFILSPTFRGEIPRDLRKADNTSVIFFRTVGWIPGRSEGDTGKYCFFSPDDLLAQPRSPSSSRQGNWGLQCKPHSLVGSNRLASLQLGAAIDLENHKRWETQLCPLIDIPPEAEVVVLSTQYGRLVDKVGFRNCDIETSQHFLSSGYSDEILGEGVDQCEPGEVDVLVERSGPMFFFLKGQGALKWNFEVSARSEILGVVTVNDRPQFVSGLPESVPFSQYVPDDRGLPDGCRNGLLNASPMVGGPAIQLFEMMLNKISGRDIDLLINNGISPEQDSQTPDSIRAYTTFVLK